MPTKTLQLLNLGGFLIVILLNTLANAIPLNGYNTGQISDFYPNLFVPIPFTFSIWGIIYILLLIFTIYQVRDWSRQKAVNLNFLQNIGPWFFVSCLANASWILAWHHLQITLSLLIMLILLGSLIIIYLRLGIGTDQVEKSANKWAVRLPISIYLGWITVATIANVTALLVANDWAGGPLSPSMWTVIMITIAGIIGSIVLLKRADIGYALVLIWAFYGIYYKQNLNPDPEAASIVKTALIAMTVLAIIASARIRRWLIN